MKRIGIAQVWQESNSFNPVHTSLSDFTLAEEQTGLTLFGKGEEVGGFLKGISDWNLSCDPIGLVFAQAWPGGVITQKTRQILVDKLHRHLKKAGRLDGMLFSLHGALVSEDDDDVDGCLLETVRNILGPHVPVVSTIDLHAHITRRMCLLSDVLVAYHTSPHLDRFGTGLRAVRIMEKIFRGSQPALALLRIPMLIMGEVTVSEGAVLKPVFSRLVELEKRPDILSAAVLMTQPCIDISGQGWTTFVYTDGEKSLAEKLSRELADMCWERREKLTFELLDAKQTVDKALGIPGKPVIIADGADATNSGACGDSIHLLQEMLTRHIPEGALAIMVDPRAVTHANTIGKGGQFEFAVGGKRDTVFSKPLKVKGEVLTLKPARYILSGHLGDRLPIDMGRSAAVRLGDVTLLLVEKTGPGSSPEMYRCVGLEPKEFKLVVVKSPAGFRADFDPFAAGIVLSACPGCASPRLDGLPFRKIDRPLWPLDRFEDRNEPDWIKRLKV